MSMGIEEKKQTVCAVVVTYNRKTLLLECFEALRKQTRPVDAIYIISLALKEQLIFIFRPKGGFRYAL